MSNPWGRQQPFWSNLAGSATTTTRQLLIDAKKLEQKMEVQALLLRLLLPLFGMTRSGFSNRTQKVFVPASFELFHSALLFPVNIICIQESQFLFFINLFILRDFDCFHSPRDSNQTFNQNHWFFKPIGEKVLD